MLFYSYCGLYLLTSVGKYYSIIETEGSTIYARQSIFYIMDEYYYGIKPRYIINAVPKELWLMSPIMSAYLLYNQIYGALSKSTNEESTVVIINGVIVKAIVRNVLN